MNSESAYYHNNCAYQTEEIQKGLNKIKELTGKPKWVMIQEAMIEYIEKWENQKEVGKP